MAPSQSCSEKALLPLSFKAVAVSESEVDVIVVTGTGGASACTRIVEEGK